MENGKSKIIDRILSDGQLKCDKIIENAATAANNIVDAAKDAVAADLLRQKNRLDADSKDSIRRFLSAAELSSKKYALAQKQDLISAAFARAENQIKNLSQQQYIEFIRMLLKKYSSAGETLIVAKNDAAIIDESIAKQFGLVLSDKVGDFDGGIILVGDGYEKNLTLAAIMQELRQQNEIEVAQILFKGD